MQFSLSAGGKKLDVTAALQAQRATIVAAQPATQEVIDSVIAHVDGELVSVADEESVSVSASVYLTITKPVASLD